MGLGGFHTVIPTPGKGQRAAKHLVAVAPKGSTGKMTREDALRHELEHANNRKPMSAQARRIRIATRGRKGWREEARADAATTRPMKSGYQDMADNPKEAEAMGGSPLIGGNPSDMRAYVKTKKKIIAARGNSRRKPITLTRLDGTDLKVITDDRKHMQRTIATPPPRKPFKVNAKGVVTKSSQSAAVKTSRLVLRLRHSGNLFRASSGGNIQSGNELADSVQGWKLSPHHKKGSRPLPKPVALSREHLRGGVKLKGDKAIVTRGVEDPKFVESPRTRKTALERRASAERTRLIVERQGDQKKALARNLATAAHSDVTGTEKLINERPLGEVARRRSRHGMPIGRPVGSPDGPIRR
jgi:hypothetical protein